MMWPAATKSLDGLMASRGCSFPCQGRESGRAANLFWRQAWSVRTEYLSCSKGGQEERVLEREREGREVWRARWGQP